MSKACQVSGKKYNNANRVSHSNRKVSHAQLPNLQWKRFWVPEQKRFVKMRVCTKVRKTIDRFGVMAALERYGADPQIVLAQ